MQIFQSPEVLTNGHEGIINPPPEHSRQIETKHFTDHHSGLPESRIQIVQFEPTRHRQLIIWNEVPLPSGTCDANADAIGGILRRSRLILNHYITIDLQAVVRVLQQVAR